jgi:hypothetical protein
MVAKKYTQQRLWKPTGQEDVNLEIRERKYGWIGHTVRKTRK